MSFFGDLLSSATRFVGDLVGDKTGDAIGDKIGDVIGNVIGNDKIGDSVGDFIGGKVGGEGTVSEFLSSRSDQIGDVVGDLFGSAKAGDAVGVVLEGLQGEGADGSSHADAAATTEPQAEVSTSAATADIAVEPTDKIDLSQISRPVESDLEAMPQIADMEFGNGSEGFDNSMPDMPADMVTMTPGDLSVTPQDMMV